MQRWLATRRSQETTCASDSSRPQAAIQLEEHLLRQVLGCRPAAQHVQRDAEHHVLVAANQGGEGRLVAGLGLGQEVLGVNGGGCELRGRRRE